MKADRKRESARAHTHKGDRESQTQTHSHTDTHTAGRGQGDEGGDDTRAGHACPGSFLMPKETYWKTNETYS